jgi:hypothetical protein
MAKAKASPSADTWPAEGPIRVVCEQNAGVLWDTYLACERNVARDLADRRKADLHGFASLAPLPDAKHRLDAYEDAKAALTAWFRGYLGQQELSARPDSRLAERKRIPASAIGGLKFDFEAGTASGEGLPPLYDVCLCRAGAPAVVDTILEDVPAMERKPAGAKAAYDWDALHAECLRRIDDNGLPDNVAQFTTALLEWCAVQFGETFTPDFETARKYVPRWIKGWERSLPRK